MRGAGSCGTVSSRCFDADVPIEQISRLVGHSSSITTETVYRKQIRPVIVHGADVMDRIFPGGPTPDA
jgi:integrase